MELTFAPTVSAFPSALQGLSVLRTRRQQRVHDQLAQLALVRCPTTRARNGRKTGRLFLAVVPPAEVAERIARLTRHLRIGHELTGKPLQPEHLHVPLCHLHDFGVSDDVVERATERAAGIAMPSFQVGFDRVGSLKNGAFALRSDESLLGLEVLQQRLSDSFDNRPRPARPFTPRMILLRDVHRVPDHAIEPIEWQVKDVVLVHSLLGRTTHRHLARIPLG